MSGKSINIKVGEKDPNALTPQKAWARIEKLDGFIRKAEMRLKSHENSLRKIVDGNGVDKALIEKGVQILERLSKEGNPL